jgi:3-keto-L-gulonate-6-phosphate decarboxylase
LKKFISCALVVALASASLWAGPDPDPAHAAQIRKRVAESVRHHYLVVVETYDHRQLQGSVSEAQADSFVLTHQGRSTTLTYAEIEKISWSSWGNRELKAVIAAVAIAGGLYLAVRLLGGLRD